MHWIFLSPHLDDAILSCGGLIYELIQEQELVEVWTILAGDPPRRPLSPLALELHERWQVGRDAPAVRRAEDKQACRVLGIKPVHFKFPECIYRLNPETGKPLIGANEELFQTLPEFEYPLAHQITRLIVDRLPSDSQIVAPLSIGGHIDHYLARRAAEALGRGLVYYADFPYSGRDSRGINASIDPGWQLIQKSVSDRGLSEWQTAVAAYSTQISTFWSSLDEMRSALRQYRDRGGGESLWVP